MAQRTSVSSKMLMSSSKTKTCFMPSDEEIAARMAYVGWESLVFFIWI